MFFTRAIPNRFHISSPAGEAIAMSVNNSDSKETINSLIYFLRAEESKRKKRVERQRLRQRQRRGAKVFRSVINSTGHLTLAPSRLFEKTPMSPSDSLDEIALQIPRRHINISIFGFSLLLNLTIVFQLIKENERVDYIMIEFAFKITQGKRCIHLPAELNKTQVKSTLSGSLRQLVYLFVGKVNLLVDCMRDNGISDNKLKQEEEITLLLTALSDFKANIKFPSEIRQEDKFETAKDFSIKVLTAWFTSVNLQDSTTFALDTLTNRFANSAEKAKRSRFKISASIFTSVLLLRTERQYMLFFYNATFIKRNRIQSAHKSLLRGLEMQ
uniref:Uncharacterized protein n=1 Tax=Glossina austeni TaxID=7395 RepID=A0A1A9UDA8_GLOAU